MNENVIVKKYEINKPLIPKIDSLIDNSLRECHYKGSHTFDHTCAYDINFTNITNNETVNLTISDKNMAFYELNHKLKNARERGFLFNQRKNFEIIIYNDLSNINIH